MTSTAGFVWHERYAWGQQADGAQTSPASAMFEPLPSNEGPEAKRRVRNLLDVSGLLRRLHQIDPVMPSEADLLRVHGRDYLARLEAASAAGAGIVSGPIGPTMTVLESTWDIARLAAGGSIAAVAAVLRGEVANAYALVRPPGHHALPDLAMGYCFLSNVALAARYAQAVHGLARVAIIDWDVHHGNGTQDVFWTDPLVLTISLHQEGAYPYLSGKIEETGAGAGAGTNINIPLLPGSGHGAYISAFERVVVPAVTRFRPDLILVACGFDAANSDNTGRMMLHADSFRAMTRMLMHVAAETCGGRLVLSHEGGYNPATVPYLALAVIEELSAERTEVVDPFLPIWKAAPGQALHAFQTAQIDRVVAQARAIGRI